MKIGLFVKDFAIGKKFSKDGIPTKSGAEFHAENHAKQLMRLGHHVTIMTKKRYFFTKARENIDGIDLVRLHEPSRGLEIILRLLTTHRDIDTFYILGTPKFAVWAILVAQLLHKPVTLSLTGNYEIFQSRKNWRMRVFSMCDHYLALSKEIRHGLLQQGGIPADKITVLGQGIATARFPVPSAAQKLALRRKYRLPAEAVIVLFCARVVYDKGIDTAEKIWPVIHARFPRAHFLVVGGGKNDILDDLRNLSAEQDNTIHVIGEVDDPSEYYQMADLYFFPSRHEGLPTTLMEAMSCGLPSVVSDIGGCSDLVEEGKSGYRVEAEDVAGFAEKLIALLGDAERRKLMGQYAAAFVRKKHDYQQVIGRLEEMLSRGVQSREKK